MRTKSKLKTAGDLLNFLELGECCAETYGTKTICYLGVPKGEEDPQDKRLDQAQRQTTLMRSLGKAGFKLDFDYCYQNPTRVAVQVSTVNAHCERPFTIQLIWKQGRHGAVPSSRVKKDRW